MEKTLKVYFWSAGEGRRLRVRESDADFIQVSEQVGRVLIDPIGSCPLQLFTAIAPGEQSHRDGERGLAWEQDILAGKMPNWD